jgi:hypothetical protein
MAAESEQESGYAWGSASGCWWALAWEPGSEPAWEAVSAVMLVMAWGCLLGQATAPAKALATGLQLEKELGGGMVAM